MENPRAIFKKFGKKIIKHLISTQSGDVLAFYADVTDLIDDLNHKSNTSIQEKIDKFIN